MASGVVLQSPVVLLAMAATAFLAGADTLGLALGIPLLIVAATVTTTNWCVPSLIYGLLRDTRARVTA